MKNLMINKVTLIGNLGKDPEIKNFPSGSVCTVFSIATSESYKDKAGAWQTNTEWHNIVTWGKLAELVAKKYSKGNKVYIEGKIAYSQYENKEGKTIYRTDIIASFARDLTHREKHSDSSGFAPLQDAGGLGAPAVPAKAEDNFDDLPF